MKPWIATTLAELQREYQLAQEHALETHAARYLAIAADDEAKRLRGNLAKLLEDFREYAESTAEGGVQ